mmetsp:Transcript_46265/g.93347  ORF Transcript_46265/g.93347 Transcript_46265/m.93347 type:complete len:178 (+) Transcript_46265:77-610(+)
MAAEERDGDSEASSYSPFVACRSGCAFWAFALISTDMYFTITEPPAHISQRFMLATESFNMSLMSLVCVMLMQRDEVVLQPVKQHVSALQRVVGRFVWFLGWPRLSWSICLLLALEGWLRAQDKYMLGGVWCEWLVTFWKAFAFVTASICSAELLAGIYSSLVRKLGAGSAKAGKGD